MKILSAVLFSVILSACSNSPTESDAKDVIKNALNGCSAVTLVGLKKKNGIADGNRYQVSIDYSLKISPPSNAEKIRKQIATASAEIDQRLQVARKEKILSEENHRTNVENLRKFGLESQTVSDASAKAAVDAANNAIANRCKTGSDCANLSSEISQKAYKSRQSRGAEHQELIAKRDEGMAKMDIAKVLVKKIEAESDEVRALPSNGFANECPNIDKSIRNGIAEAAEKFDASNQGNNAYLAGFITDFTGTLNFVKTDNGWKSGL